jgi:DtxR family Mn-dependent transcriptional regulator
MHSPTEENYLKALYHLSGESGEITASELSKQLKLTPPTVNNMIKRLAEKGLVDYAKYQPLKLTAEGQKKAALIVRKHRLTEMFLVEKMGFGWEEVHDIAEQLEHIDSEVFFERMDRLLGNPSVDPHGSPIPDKGGNVADMQLVALSECEAGNTFTFLAVQQSSDSFLKYLNERALKLGLQLKIIDKEPFDGSLEVAIEGVDKPLIMSKKVTQRLLGKLL